MAFDQNKYNQEYKKENYDRIVLTVHKGKKQELKEFAKTQGITMTDLFKKALWNTYKIQI